MHAIRLKTPASRRKARDARALTNFWLSCAITPDQVSRLVARLGRGQFGLYFTTSWYSEQTQKEIEADGYPVRLFSGQAIVNILRAGDCVSGGRLRSDWKELALAEVEGEVADGLRPTSLW